MGTERKSFLQGSLTKQQKSPKWDVFDKEIPGEGGPKCLSHNVSEIPRGNQRQQNTYDTRGEDVLHIHNPLEFKKEKVGQIVKFVKQLLNRISRDGVVAFGAH